MSLCINPSCPQPEHPQNLHNRYCQVCGSDLLLDGRYRVMRLLSDDSGFGKIYEAFDQTTAKILKVLKENLNNNSKAVELFEQEAKVLKQLNHPGIPQVDGYFSYQTRDGLVLHCLVMEKIEGLNLEQWLQQQENQPISQEQAIAWLKQLAQILDLVHKANWFHRDIKPPNIMLRDSGQLVLIDFGTAREKTHTYLAKLGAGQNMTAVVSAEYTPPEQIYGQAVSQSDFFALGRTFVHLLTGQSPLKFYDAYNDVFQWRQAANISPLLAGLLDNFMAQKPVDRPLNAEILLREIEDVERKLIKKGNSKSSLFPWIGRLLGSGDNGSNMGQPPVTSPQAKIWNLGTGELIRTLFDHSSYVSSVAISPDGQTLVSGSWDNTIKIWNLGTGELIRTLSGHFFWVDSVAISPDGQTLVSGSGDNTIKIWRLGTGELIRTLSGHSRWVNSVVISPDGQTLISGSWDKKIKIWDLGTGELIRTFSPRSSYIQSVEISPDGQTLISGNADNTIKIWNLGTEELIRTLSGHSCWVKSVAISPDGQTLISGSDDKKIKIWNLGTGELIRTLSPRSSYINSVAISPDGQTLISGSADKTIKIWNLGTGELIRTLSGHSRGVMSVAISPDGKTLVSGSWDKTIKIWRVPQ